MMNLKELLSKYKSADVKRPAQNRILTPVERRVKVADAIDEQIKIVNGQLTGKPYIAMVEDTSEGAAPGAMRKKVLKHWYWITRDGKVWAEVNYGPSSLKIGKGSKFEVGSLKELPAFFEAMKDVLNAGQLDDAIAAASVRASAILKKAA